ERHRVRQRTDDPEEGRLQIILPTPTETSMTMHRVACIFTGAVALALSTCNAVANDDYPSQPIRLIVPYSAGGGTDTVARQWGERIGQRLGQSVIVENRPGANGVIGTRVVATAEPDGHTLV